jgi:hypothetical protein
MPIPQEVSMTRKIWLAVAASALLATAGACDQAARDQPEADGVRPTPAGGDRALPESASQSAALAPIDHSGITGTVATEQSGDDVTVTLAVEGLEPRSRYPSFLHDGRCAAGGPERLPLGILEPGEDGRADARFQAPAAGLTPGEDWSVQVRTGTGEAVACATITHP